ncbi:MAG: BamA/TamA family outer membrane protein [Pirellulales bacterium]
MTHRNRTTALTLAIVLATSLAGCAGPTFVAQRPTPSVAPPTGYAAAAPAAAAPPATAAAPAYTPHTAAPQTVTPPPALGPFAAGPTRVPGEAPTLAAAPPAAPGVAESPRPIVRGQDPGYQPPAYQPPAYQPPAGAGAGGYGTAGAYGAPPPATGVAPASNPAWTLPGGTGANPYGDVPAGPVAEMQPAGSFADIIANVTETQTGRFQFGVGINSDAGVTGQIVIDERNFDWQRVPHSFDEVINGTAWRGAGQGFRIEAMPGNQVQRYMVSFTEPYLFGYSPISLSLSAFYFTRAYFDYDEERLGGRAALGYRLGPDLSIAGALRAESVDITNPRVLGVPELDRILGQSELYTGRVTLTHDTRDIPFFPTEGHYFELALEQAFGTFDYPRAEIDYRRYFLIRERPDNSGRHTLAFSGKLGFSGTDTPMYENYFAGGYSTLRGFDFRGASPVSGGVIVGGQFRFLGSAEYFFPLTADDMVKGVVFCDVGTVEQQIEVDWGNFRVAPGFGLRINIPALGPAPLALDFAVPVAHAPTDNIQNFSFFFGFGR